MTNVGLIGIGAMGEPMAASLIRAGFAVAVCAHRNRAPLERLVAAGAVDAGDPAGVGQASDVVITMVPDAPQVDESLFGSHGAATAAKPGTLFVDMSTISPVSTKAFAERLTAGGFRFVDSPVSGGPARAATGTLALMVGASAEDLALAEPVLKALGTPNHVGPVGMGETVKLVNQILIANTMIANVEALVFAKKAGAKVDVVRDVILTATGANYILDKWLPTTWLSGSFDAGFALDLLRKDLAAALDAARGMGVPLPLSALSYQMYTATSGNGHGREDYFRGRALLSRRRRSQRRGQRLAAVLFGAIDVGTNSIHLILVEFDSTFDTTRVVYKDREMVRLGSDDALERGQLSNKAMRRGVDAMTRFVAGARSRGAERIRAVATSAVREAENGDAFRALVEAEAGIPLEILSAQEEARLIHLGVASGFPIYERLACVIDIGGGSTEFIVADGERPYLLDSVKLGSLRLYDMFLRGKDPKRGARDLNKHILATLAPLIDRVRRYRLDLMIGTSGTIMGLAALDAAAQGLTVNRMHGYTIARDRLEQLQREMLQMTENERRRMPGMNPRRSDIIVAGNAVLIAALAQLGRDEIVVCERALRDGIIVDMVSQDRALADRLGDERVRRIEAVEALAHRYSHLGGHQRQVARLAIALFERLAGVHDLAPSDRDILYAAAILHSIGRFIADSAHHKHTAYIIRNSILAGWRDDERELIAQVARYYRKAMPKPSHLEFALLAPAQQHRVEVLAAILRIAQGLDNRELGVVTDVTIRREDGRIAIVAQADGGVSSELGAAMLKADLFERTFGVRATFESVVPETRL